LSKKQTLFEQLAAMKSGAKVTGKKADVPGPRAEAGAGPLPKPPRRRIVDAPDPVAVLRRGVLKVLLASRLPIGTDDIAAAVPDSGEGHRDRVGLMLDTLARGIRPPLVMRTGRGPHVAFEISPGPGHRALAQHEADPAACTAAVLRALAYVGTHDPVRSHANRVARPISWVAAEMMYGQYGQFRPSDELCRVILEGLAAAGKAERSEVAGAVAAWYRTVT
jgi:hypothetical protein